jgi:prolipoprotein diacylglyceryl transferase
MTAPAVAGAVLADIPSPSTGVLEVGPLSIHAYGLMIALGVVAAVWLAGRRLEDKRVGTREDMSSIALWAVPAGVIGARLYHVITDWELFEDDLARIPQIWRGGLGVPGGILAGTVVGLWRGRRRGIRPATLADCAAPAIPLAQAIGRWGNYFNQELFGSPTSLPWALRVSEEKAALAGHPPGTTFHPTFLYESLWNLALCGALLAIDRRVRLRRGSLFAMYVVGYGVGRFWIEGLRIDPAHVGGGLRLNQWVAIALVVSGLAYLLFVSGRPPRDADSDAGDRGRDARDGDPAATDDLDTVERADRGDGLDGVDVVRVEARSRVADQRVADPRVADARGTDPVSESDPADRRRYVAEDG